MKNSLSYLLLFTIVLLLSSCLKDTDNAEAVYCDPAVSNAAFRVVDKNTKTDLFFGDTPKYKQADLKIYPLKYKSETDTLQLKTFTSTSVKAFIFTIKHAQDTLLIKIADTRMDTLIYTVNQPTNVCSPYSIKQAYFNRDEILQENGVFILKK